MEPTIIRDRDLVALDKESDAQGFGGYISARSERAMTASDDN